VNLVNLGAGGRVRRRKDALQIHYRNGHL
jgi:hypothetical protein